MQDMLLKVAKVLIGFDEWMRKDQDRKDSLEETITDHLNKKSNKTG